MGKKRRPILLNPKGSSALAKFHAKSQKNSVGRAVRSSKKGQALGKAYAFDAERFARAFRFAEPCSNTLQNESRWHAVMDRRPNVVGWNFWWNDHPEKSAMEVAVRFDCRSDTRKPLEDQVALWNLTEMVLFAKALKHIGTKRTRKIPTPMALCAYCPAFWWSLALWSFAEVMRTVTKQDWDRKPKKSRRKRFRRHLGGFPTEDEENEEAQRPQADAGMLQMVAAEDDEQPEPPETKEFSMYWPPTCPGRRAVSIPGPFDRLIRVLFEAAWKDDTEEEIKRQLAAVLGVEAGPMERSCHEIRDELYAATWKEEEPERKALAAKRREVLAKNREYRWQTKKKCPDQPIRDVGGPENEKLTMETELKNEERNLPEPPVLPYLPEYSLVLDENDEEEREPAMAGQVNQSGMEEMPQEERTERKKDKEKKERKKMHKEENFQEADEADMKRSELNKEKKKEEKKKIEEKEKTEKKKRKKAEQEVDGEDADSKRDELNKEKKKEEEEKKEEKEKTEKKKRKKAEQEVVGEEADSKRDELNKEKKKEEEEKKEEKTKKKERKKRDPHLEELCAQIRAQEADITRPQRKKRKIYPITIH